MAKAAAVSIKTVSPERLYRELAFLLTLPANPLQLEAQLDKGRKKLALTKALRDPQHAARRQLPDGPARADSQAMYAYLCPGTAVRAVEGP